MTEMLHHAHSGWRYLVILAVAMVLVHALLSLARGRAWCRGDARLGLVAMIVVDVQALLGLLRMIQLKAWTVPLYAEHLVTMLLAVVAVHLARIRARKASSDRRKYALTALGYAVAGGLIGIGIWRITGGF